MVKRYNRGVKLKKVLKSGLSGILWVGMTMFYLWFSMATMAWQLTWLLFPFAVILQIILNAMLDD